MFGCLLMSKKGRDQELHCVAQSVKVKLFPLQARYAPEGG